jgi:hypothetical protein
MINLILAAEIINGYLTNNGFGDIHVTPEELDHPGALEAYGMIWPGEPFNDFCVKLFRNLSEDHSEKRDFTLFHFKDADTGLKIIESQILQASHLPHQSENDAQEFRYFMEQMGHALANPDLQIPEEMTEAFGEFQSIDQMREDVYILCFTKTDSKEKFWEQYANWHTGICFQFRYSSTGNRMIDGQFFESYSLRDMIYDNDNNNRFKFFDEMSRELEVRVGYKLMITEVPRFAVYYKRSPYNWEDEIRLGIDIAYLNARHVQHGITHKLSPDGKRKFIPIPIKGNELFFGYEFPFELELVRIQCGKEMTDEMYEKVKELTNRKFPGIEVMRRH